MSLTSVFKSKSDKKRHTRLHNNWKLVQTIITCVVGTHRDADIFGSEWRESVECGPTFPDM